MTEKVANSRLITAVILGIIYMILDKEETIENCTFFTALTDLTYNKIFGVDIDK